MTKCTRTIACILSLPSARARWPYAHGEGMRRTCGHNGWQQPSGGSGRQGLSRQALLRDRLRAACHTLERFLIARLTLVAFPLGGQLANLVGPVTCRSRFGWPFVAPKLKD